MLDRAALGGLQAAFGALDGVLVMRLEERGALAANATPGAPPSRARVGELAARALGSGRGEGLPRVGAFGGEGPLGELIAHYELAPAEALAIVAALAPEVDERFDVLYAALADRPGTTGLTGETLRTILARTFAGRLRAADVLAPGGKLRSLRMLTLEAADPHLAGRVRCNPELAAWLLGRAEPEPELSPEFPAQRLRTVHALDDLVLTVSARERLDAILVRMRHRAIVLDDWGFGSHHDNAGGFTVLFHGPSGTGKTLAAAVLGREAAVPVYRIDLSSVLDKYIGETEKGLSRLFDRAEARDWVLFFDEADALFGRRGEINDAHDRFANAQISYLLQRIETFSGVTVLATNLLRNIDEAFLRRIHLHLAFPEPTIDERMRLWGVALPSKELLDPEVDLGELAERHELTGGEIRNAVFHAAYRASANGRRIDRDDLEEGVRIEYEKVGRLPAPA